MRAQQISRSSPLYIYLDEEQLKSLNPLEIAELELAQKKIPFILRRFLPNDQYEDWKLEELHLWVIETLDPLFITLK